MDLWSANTLGCPEEAYLATEFLKRGWIVNFPIFGTIAYDLVLDAGTGKLYRIQVKKIQHKFEKARKGRKGRLRILADLRRGKDKNKYYNSSDFDYIAAVDVDNQIVYIFPSTYVDTHRTVDFGRYQRKEFEQYSFSVFAEKIESCKNKEKKSAVEAEFDVIIPHQEMNRMLKERGVRVVSSSSFA